MLSSRPPALRHRLQQDFTQLLRHAHALAAPTGLDLPFLAPLMPANATDQAVQRYFALPHSQGGTGYQQEKCTVADLPTSLRDQLLSRFAADAALHRRVCAGGSTQKDVASRAQREQREVVHDTCRPNATSVATQTRADRMGPEKAVRTPAG